jgi:hypothetical protein
MLLPSPSAIEERSCEFSLKMAKSFRPAEEATRPLSRDAPRIRGQRSEERSERRNRPTNLEIIRSPIWQTLAWRGWIQTCFRRGRGTHAQSSRSPAEKQSPSSSLCPQQLLFNSDDASVKFFSHLGVPPEEGESRVSLEPCAAQRNQRPLLARGISEPGIVSMSNLPS